MYMQINNRYKTQILFHVPSRCMYMQINNCYETQILLHVPSRCMYQQINDRYEFQVLFRVSNRCTCMQINDRYEFPELLDLDRDERKYMSSNADPNVRNLYRLHSVLVHSGGVHGGHYFAFIRPTGDTYLKFDDEKVPAPQSMAA